MSTNTDFATRYFVDIAQKYMVKIGIIIQFSMIYQTLYIILHIIHDFCINNRMIYTTYTYIHVCGNEYLIGAVIVMYTAIIACQSLYGGSE